MSWRFVRNPQVGDKVKFKEEIGFEKVRDFFVDKLGFIPVWEDMEISTRSSSVHFTDKGDSVEEISYVVEINERTSSGTISRHVAVPGNWLELAEE